MIKILVSVLLMVSLGHVVLSQSLMERADASQIMAYVKITSIRDRETQSYGEKYTAVVELLCQIKVNRGTILPETFTIEDLGERPDGAPSRQVNVREEYIFFLTKKTTAIFTVDEVSGQSGVIPATWDNMQALSSYVQACLTGPCRSDPSQMPPNWTPMSETERAAQAEIVVWAKVLKKHEYGSTQGYYIAQSETICGMQLPSDMQEKGFPKQFNITNVGAIEGLCEDRHLSEGHEFIMFLTRHFAVFPLPGQPIPPEQLENYVLGLDEVNSQHAIFNVTAGEKVKFADLLAGCDGGGGGGGGASLVTFQPLFYFISFLVSFLHCVSLKAVF